MADDDEESCPPYLEPRFRYLPRNNILRVMRDALPVSAKMSLDSRECVRECVSEFISFVASEAGDICSRAGRKTLTADDIIDGMLNLGFDNYITPLCIYLAKLREQQQQQEVEQGKEAKVKNRPVDSNEVSSEKNEESGNIEKEGKDEKKEKESDLTIEQDIIMSKDKVDDDVKDKEMIEKDHSSLNPEPASEEKKESESSKPVLVSSSTLSPSN